MKVFSLVTVLLLIGLTQWVVAAPLTEEAQLYTVADFISNIPEPALLSLLGLGLASLGMIGRGKA